jgi:hypothetical protein
MNDNHPITPTPELLEQWEAETAHTTKDEAWHIAVQAARWGADQELEACCKWLPKLPPWSADDLRRHRRPKPPSLKEQALERLELAKKYVDVEPIRRAIEQLPD